MSNEMKMTEIIAELERIDGLYERYQHLDRQMNGISGEKEKEDEALGNDVVLTLHEYREAQDEKFNAKKPSIAAPCLAAPPCAPEKPKDITAKNFFMASASGLVALGSFIIWCVLAALNSDSILVGLLSGLLTIVILGAAGYWFAVGSHKVTAVVEWQAKQAEWEKQQAEWEAAFNRAATEQESQRFLAECQTYDTAFLSLVDVCSKKYREEFARYEAGLEAIKDKYLKKLNDIHEEIQGVLTQLEQVTLIHSSLIPSAWRILNMLRTGRADTLKEAINLAADEERKDAEEAARQEEAMQQQRLMEQQAHDARMHNAAMERAAEEEARAMRAHNAAMERAAADQARAAERQAREAAKQTEMAKQQARDAQRAASARCARCANYSKCSYQVRQNAANCSAYTPK
ncbi:MAG: hypothetical protein IJW97_03220 [Clostridia bacterium]|nr:hypothetical protein [Clostridia bacterium]